MISFGIESSSLDESSETKSKRAKTKREPEYGVNANGELYKVTNFLCLRFCFRLLDVIKACTDVSRHRLISSLLSIHVDRFLNQICTILKQSKYQKQQKYEKFSKDFVVLEFQKVLIGFDSCQDSAIARENHVLEFLSSCETVENVERLLNS